MKKLLAVATLLTFCMFTALSHAMGTPAGQGFTTCKSVLESEIELTETSDLRIGPGYSYPSIGMAKPGEKFGVVGMLNEWYIVQCGDGSIGVLDSGITRITRLKEIATRQGSDDESSPDDTDGSVDDATSDLFRLVNALRSENSLQPFEWDLRLNKIAAIKAEDMSKNNYFGHYSKIYGTPFKMLKEMDFEFKNASECIANSADSHDVDFFGDAANRANIMSGHFNKMGVGKSESGENEITVLLFVKEP